MPAPPPPYELTFEERQQYLYARVQADTVTEEIARGYLAEIAARCREIDCERLLIHRDIPSTLGDGTQFFVSADFQKMAGGVKVAFVNPYLSNETSLRFAMTVSNNRGGDFALFNNDAAAEKWLLSV